MEERVAGPIVVAGFAAVLALLAAVSTPRSIGDGDEYILMARRLASLEMPRPGETTHFWFYSALAAPGYALAQRAGIDPLRAFTVLNGLLLVLACWSMSRRLSWASTILLCVSPIVWWLDKPHTEPLVAAALAVAFASLPDAPWWSVAAVATASTQYPTMALLVPVVAASAIARRRGVVTERRFWIGIGSAAVLTAIHPAYYLVRLSVLTRLDRGIAAHVPSARELLTPIVDPNLGLLPNFPVFAMLALVGVAVLAWRAPRELRTPEMLAAAAAAALFALMASQTTNVNHGGTPGLSRYATWFIPLAIPLFAALDARRSATPPMYAAACLVSAVACVWLYNPAAPERVSSPSPLARFLWTRHPALDNPLPEVFVERLGAIDEDWVPARTPGCEKVLVESRGPRTSVWPMPCAPVPVPAECQLSGVMCFANRTATGYDFTRAPGSRVSALGFRLAREKTWPLAAIPAARRILDGLRWWEMSVREVADQDAMVAATHDAGRVFLLQAPDRLFAIAIAPGPEARLVIRTTRGMQADLLSSERVDRPPQRIVVPPSRGEQAISLPGPTAWVVLTLRVLPAP